MHLATPNTYLASPRQYVLARLYCRLLEDLLQPDVYYAELASTAYSLTCSEDGLVLQVRCGEKCGEKCGEALRGARLFEAPSYANLLLAPRVRASYATPQLQGYNSVVVKLMSVVMRAMKEGMLSQQFLESR